MNVRYLWRGRHFLLAAAVLILPYTGRAGTIYASNFATNTIAAYDATTGSPLGTLVSAGAEAAGFNGILVGSDGSFFITAQLTNNVLHYGRDGSLVQLFDPANLGGLDSPQDVVLGPDGKLYVASAGNDKVLRYDPASGDFLDVFSDLSPLGHMGPVGLVFGSDGDLYVTALDGGRVIKVRGSTGELLGETSAPAGVGLAAVAAGPDGYLYIAGFDLSSSEGGVYRYNLTGDSLDSLIVTGSGGLLSPGGLTFAPDGTLLVANLVVGPDLQDGGSSILRFDRNGTPLGTLVGSGDGLGIPFFLGQDVPEPTSAVLIGIGLVLLGSYATPKKRDEPTARIAAEKSSCQLEGKT